MNLLLVVGKKRWRRKKTVIGVSRYYIKTKERGVTVRIFRVERYKYKDNEF